MGGDVLFWFPSGDAIGNPVTKKMVSGYNASSGKTDKITVTGDPVSDSNNSIKYTSGMTSTHSPDAVQTYGYNVLVDWAANGFIQPMDSYLDQLGLKESDYYPFCWQMQHVNGKTWGLMQEWDADLLCWNKDIHSGDAPTTTDEIDELSKQYTKFDSSGKLTQVGIIPWEQGGFTTSGWGDWGPVFGAQFYDSDKGKWTITNPENTRFLDWYLKYVDLLGGRAKADAFVSAVPKSYGYADIFNHGKAAFSMEGEWFPKELAATTKGAVTLNYAISDKVVAAPDINSGKMSTVAGANLFLIPTKAKNPASAARFIKYMVQTPQLVSWSEPIGQGMPTKAAANSPALFKVLPYMKTWADAAAAGWFVAPPISPVYSVFDTAMGTAVDNVTRKKQTPTEALEAVATQVSQSLSRFKASNPKWPSE